MALQVPPRVPGHPLLGNLPSYRKDPLSFGRHVAAAYGDVVDLRVFNRRIFFLAHPEHIHQVLVRDADKFHKSPVYRIFLGRALGEGLLTSDGDFWRRQRRLAQPAFHHGRIQSYAQTMVSYADAAAARWRGSETLLLNREMAQLTLEIVSQTLFSTDIRAQADTIGHALSELLEAISEATGAAVFVPEWLPTRNNRRIRRGVAELDSVIMPLIEARRRSGEDTGDLLSMLLLARDEDGQGMSDKQVRDEAVTLVLAGHETTANALTWAWVLLAQHPEVEAKLHAELDAVLQGELPRLEHVRSLTYTEGVIKETMRLYPPIPEFARQALEDVPLGAFVIPKGTIVMVPVFAMHHDPRWFEDPDAFRPERFAKGAEKALPKLAYLPFGGGPRVCIGNAFAQMEAILLLATLAQRYRLRLEPQQQVTPEATLTLRPKGDLRMQLEPR